MPSAAPEYLPDLPKYRNSEVYLQPLVQLSRSLRGAVLFWRECGLDASQGANVNPVELEIMQFEKVYPVFVAYRADR